MASKLRFQSPISLQWFGIKTNTNVDDTMEDINDIMA